MRDNCNVQLLNDMGINVEEEISPPEWGQGRLRVFQNTSERFVLKTLPLQSPLHKLPAGLCNEMFDLLYQHTNTLNLPLPLAGNYLFDFNGSKSMLFPWIGPLSGNRPRWDMDIHEQLSFLAKLNSELGRLPASLIERLKRASFRIDFHDESFVAKLNLCRPFIGNILYDKCLSLLAFKDSHWNSDCINKLVHTDFNGSNILSTGTGELIAIDIDYMRVGNDHIDFIYVVSSHGADEDSIAGLVDFYQDRIERLTSPLNFNTALLGIDLVLAWFSAIIERSYQFSNERLECGTYAVEADQLKITFSDMKEKDPHLFDAMTRQVPGFCKGLMSFVQFIASLQRTGSSCM